jgi:hypothetical protein
MERAGRNLVCLAVVCVLNTWGTGWAVEVLEPGYVVETYATYSCPEMNGSHSGIEFDSSGNLYLTHWEDYPSLGGIYRVAPDRSATKWVEGLGTPRRMAWLGGTDFGDYLYVADGTPRDILRITADGTVSTFAHVSGGPHSLALDHTGNYGDYLYVGTRSPDHIYRVSETGVVEYWSYFPGSIPAGHVDLTFDSGTKYGGLMYVALEYGSPPHSGNYGLFSVDQDGDATKFAPSIVTGWSVRIDPSGLFGGDLFFTGKCDSDQPYYSLWRADPNGQVSDFAVGTIADHLGAFTFGPDGALYVPEHSEEEGIVVVSRIVPGDVQEVAVDIKPESCPNPLNLGSRGMLTAAVLGSADFDVSSVDVATIKLVGVGPIRSSIEDVAGPVPDGNECACSEEGPDGYDDLVLKFKTQEIVGTLLDVEGELVDGEEWAFTVTGELLDGTPIEGTDCVMVRRKVPRSTAAKKSDINDDGLVDMADFAVMTARWLEYTIP